MKSEGSTMSPELLRQHADAKRTMAWDNQARMLLRWAADTLDAARAVIDERASMKSAVQEKP